MFLNWFYHDAHACATFSNTKVDSIGLGIRRRTWLTTKIIDTKVVYRRYASLFFIAGCSSADNELITLEIVHRYVEQMDKYYGNVCELDIIFNFQKAYFILDELLLAGEMQESSKKNVLRCISQQDSLEDIEVRSIYFLDFYGRPPTSFDMETHRSSTRIGELCVTSKPPGVPPEQQLTVFLPNLRSRMRASRRSDNACTTYILGSDSLSLSTLLSVYVWQYDIS